LVCWQGWQSFLTRSKVAAFAVSVNASNKSR